MFYIRGKNINKNNIIDEVEEFHQVNIYIYIKFY